MGSARAVVERWAGREESGFAKRERGVQGPAKPLDRSPKLQRRGSWRFPWLRKSTTPPCVGSLCSGSFGSRRLKACSIEALTQCAGQGRGGEEWRRWGLGCALAQLCPS